LNFKMPIYNFAFVLFAYTFQLMGYLLSIIINKIIASFKIFPNRCRENRYDVKSFILLFTKSLFLVLMKSKREKLQNK
jgi:hypothetical protein